MKRLVGLLGLVLAIVVVLGGCARGPGLRESADVTPLPGRTQVVVASWYGPDFHGKPTASGEIYDMDKFTAAHKEFPFGTRLRVTYLKTGRSTEVVVNDRGPFVRGRSLDLSRGAAEAIGLIPDGVGEVRITELGRETRYIHTVSYRSVPVTEGRLTVQIGAFQDRGNAERLRDGLRLKYTRVFMEEATVDGNLYYRVRIGEFTNRFDALTRARQLAYDGYPVQVMTIRQ